MVSGAEPFSAVMPAKRAFVYILKCADRTFYIGTAKDVAARLAVHNARRGAKYTRPRLPVRVVWQEGPMSLTRALRREYQLKQLTRLQKQALIRGKLVVPRPR
jgi:putative endonuclease